jgi:signal transduction histidine kinase
MLEIAAVVDDAVGPGQAVLSGSLTGHARPGIAFGHSSEADQPVHRDRRIDIDHEQRLDRIAEAFHEERHVEHDDVIGRPLCFDAAADLGRDGRMHDPVERLELFGIGEDDRGQTRPIELTLRRDDALAKTFGQRRERGPARLLQLTRDGVGVHDDGTSGRQKRRHRRLSAADAAGQTNEDHEESTVAVPLSRTLCRRMASQARADAVSVTQTTDSEVAFAVERRPAGDASSPDIKPERKHRVGPIIHTPSISPFRWGALLVAIVVASPQLVEWDAGLWAGLAVAFAYALFRSFYPIRYTESRSTTVELGLDAGIHTELVLLTGAWSSPFAFCLLPSILQAGFARGSRFATQLALAVILLVSLPHIAVTQQVQQGVRDAFAWFGVLVAVGVLSGFARQVSYDSAEAQTAALDRLTKLSEANTLLFQLHRLAQSLPASLDLDEVLDSTITRIRELMRFDSLTVLLYEESDGSWTVARRHGSRGNSAFGSLQLPPPLQRARNATHAFVESELEDDLRRGVAPGTRSGIYSALHARGALIGLVAVESQKPDRFSQREVDLLEGMVESLSVAIDNARWFARIRSIGADEERTRIARDLHDQIGQSLASLAFGLDHAHKVAERGDQVAPVIEDLRTELRSTVRSVREALYDLRTDVTDATDLAGTLQVFADRVSERSGIEIALDAAVVQRLPRPQEREMWWIARESIVNAERHAKPSRIDVRWRADGRRGELVVRDDGVGFDRRSGRADSYGIIGMRERASMIGATLDIVSAPGQGTKIRVAVGPASGGDE